MPIGQRGAAGRGDWQKGISGFHRFHPKTMDFLWFCVDVPSNQFRDGIDADRT